jgi:hypothetical protein
MLGVSIKGARQDILIAINIRPAKISPGLIR